MRYMSGTPGEFERALRLAFADALVTDDQGLLLTDGQVGLHFSLRDAQEMRIGALQLPCVQVEIKVLAGERAAAEKLLARVDLATLRGGG